MKARCMDADRDVDICDGCMDNKLYTWYETGGMSENDYSDMSEGGYKSDIDLIETK